MALYGSTLFGILAFGDDLESGADEEIAAPDLMQYLPSFYNRSRIMHSIQNASAEELGMLTYALDDILRQFFVQTATWGLSIWEQELGMPIDPSKPAARRREQIVAKLRGTGTTTRAMIVAAAAAFSGGEVDVIEYVDEYRFVIRFIGFLGIPPNMAGFAQMIEQIKPAHLACSFEYTYTAWNMLAGSAWSGLASKTWNDLRIYQGG